MDRVKRKQHRIQSSARHLDEAQWWFITCHKNPSKVYRVKSSSHGGRMGLYYLFIARAIKRKWLKETWVRKVGVTKAAFVAERILKDEEPLPKEFLQLIAEPDFTVRDLKEHLGLRT